MLFLALKKELSKSLLLRFSPPGKKIPSAKFPIFTGCLPPLTPYHYLENPEMCRKYLPLKSWTKVFLALGQSGFSFL